MAAAKVHFIFAHCVSTMALKYSYKVDTMQKQNFLRGFRFSSVSQMLLNKIITTYSAVPFPMSQQRSGEKICLAWRNKQQTNWETWHFSALWTISNSTQFVWPFLVGEQFHTDLPQNHSKSYTGSQTHPNESQMLERSMECERLTGRGVQWRESKTKKKGRSERNIECGSKISTYFFFF